jgi:FkbM family methyltransferase
VLTAIKRGTELGERGLEAVAGRRNTVRAARFLLDRARLDGPNQIPANGELGVQRFVLRSNSAEPPTIIDVGAHFGEWSLHLLQQAARLGVQPVVHAFEPSRFTFDRLTETLAAAPGVRLNHQGVSSRSGTAQLHKPCDGAGSSSLYQGPYREAGTEEVTLTTLDEYCTECGIGHVHLLKVDAEGHDLDALEGSRRLFAEGRVDVAQFEYNARWVDARRYLRDAFAFAESVGYELGKVTPRGIEFYETWHAELESFREGNYVMVRPVVKSDMPTVVWWGP